MGKNLQKLYSFRAEDELIIKLNYIAEQNTRTRNKEIEHIIKNHVSNFEKENGQLIVGDDGSVTVARVKDVTMGKSINSKIS